VTDLQDRAAGAFGLAVLVAVLVLAVASVAYSTGGYEPEYHRGGVPSDVHRVGDDGYFIPAGSETRVDDVCHGSDGYGSNTDVVSNVPGSGTYVECAVEQVWSVPYTHPNRTLGEGIGEAFFAPWYRILCGALALVALLATAAVYPRVRRERRRTRTDLEQRRRELVLEWSRQDTRMTDLDFDRQMDRLYASGLPPAKD
jgi:hypothetical protein